MLMSLLLALFCMLGGGSRAQPYIYVNQTAGANDTSCWYGGPDHPCNTLDLALKGVQTTSNSTWHPGIYLEEGNHTLQDISHGVFTGPRIADFRMVGSPSTEDLSPLVTITCESDYGQGTGFRFVNVSKITIAGVRFSQCGALQNSTSCDPSDCDTNMKFHAGLYFLLCMDISFDHVWVTSSSGVGVVIYSSAGENKFQHCNFSDNVADVEYSGGGGLYLEFSYCIPEIEGIITGNCYDNATVPEDYVSNATYLFSDCHFEENHATVIHTRNLTFILPQGKYHTAFGRGGGLSVFFKGRAQKNSIAVTKCHFLNNTALWGGGMFVEFQDNSSTNSLSVRNSYFMSNGVLHNSTDSEGTGGGGARIGFLFFGDSHAWHNHMHFENCKFHRNEAHWGGGVSFYTARERETVYATNTLEFINCGWFFNHAQLGAAIDLSVWHPVSDGVTVQVNFTNTKVQIHGTHDQTLGSLNGLGTLYIDSIPTTFAGYAEFTVNARTALAAVAASIDFLEGCVANFTLNHGRNGGAIALFGYSFIRVHPGAQLNFTNNTANLTGGAIFAKSVGEHDLISSRNCFIRFHDITVTPVDWTAIFIFENNTARGRPNAIYTTTVLPCLWGGAYGPSENGTAGDSQVFCWNSNWMYDGVRCPTRANQTETAPATFTHIDSDYKLEVFPGQQKSLGVNMIDDFGNNETDRMVLIVDVHSPQTAAVESTYISNGVIQLSGIPKNNVSVSLFTPDPRVVYTDVQVHLLPCPPGFIVHDTGSSTVCKCQKDKSYAGNLVCSEDHFNSSLVLAGNWIGYYNHSNTILVCGGSPYTYGLSETEKILPNKSDQLDLHLCRRVNRTRVLCGQCIENFGPVINSDRYTCKNCTDSRYSGVFFLLTELLPLTVFFFILVLFNVSLTSGPANAFILFSQIITSSFLLYGSTTTYSYTVASYDTVYDIWNLNFFDALDVFQYCLHPGMGTLTVIALEYVVAIYPLVLILLLYSVIWLYSQGVRPVVCVCRPVHHCLARVRRNWDLSRSVIDSFAAFVLLSYNKFLTISLRLLSIARLYNQSGQDVGIVPYYDGNMRAFRGEHAPYVALALLMLLLFVIPPPLILLLYPLRVFHTLVSRLTCRRWETGGKIQLFLNAFYGCFKDGTEPGTRDWRYFAGLYFVFRLTLSLLYSQSENWRLQYVVQQIISTVAVLLFAVVRPYKHDFYNNVDAVIFGILATINALSNYNYNEYNLGNSPSDVVYAVEFALIWCPLVYMVLFLIYLLLKNCRVLDRVVHCKWRVNRSQQHGRDDIADDSILRAVDEREDQRRFIRTNTDRSSEASPLLTATDSTGYLTLGDQHGTSSSHNPMSSQSHANTHSVNNSTLPPLV